MRVSLVHKSRKENFYPLICLITEYLYFKSLYSFQQSWQDTLKAISELDRSIQRILT